MYKAQVRSLGIHYFALSIVPDGEDDNDLERRLRDPQIVLNCFNHHCAKLLTFLQELHDHTASGDRDPTGAEEFDVDSQTNRPQVRVECDRLTALMDGVRTWQQTFDDENIPRTYAELPASLEEYRWLSFDDKQSVFNPMALQFAPVLFSFALPAMQYQATLRDKNMKYYLCLCLTYTAAALVNYLIVPSEEAKRLELRFGVQGGSIGPDAEGFGQHVKAYRAEYNRHIAKLIADDPQAGWQLMQDHSLVQVLPLERPGAE
ncbi:uncharacterized protein LTR77_010612 [Saxophila tyrrhenica]|uniref:Uncharacterized protein n=1 Tax=Saxophila tyrrhenica TaxID=1690608 RepID=A0AAV9NUQ0_9PEZI|nr:hypothetical protein LTR77_010612 [Saxophila tyrrhenica]